MKININGSDWDIIETVDDGKVQEDLMEDKNGLCCYRTQNIYIKKDMKIAEKKKVLFHELTHAVLSETGYNEDIRKGLGEHYEKFVDLMGSRIIDLFNAKEVLEKV